jgi:hypothetical protein
MEFNMTVTVTLSTVAATLADDCKAFRSAAVTAENKSTPFARSTLAALVSGLSTVDLVTAAVIHAFGNPNSPKTGKPVSTLSGLRPFTGGDAVRKTTETTFKLFANLDADKPRDVQNANGDTVTIGKGDIRKAITAFILNEKDSAKSLNALSDSVATALRAFAKEDADAKGADNSEAANENATTTTEAAPFDAADAIAKLTVWAAGMDEATANAMSDAMNALYQAFDARTVELADTAPVAVAA